ncbi:hypothetical protein Q9S36_39660 [Microbacterium sp. ARD31]|jgi:hypothetical protein|uniref:hypothetical protein n=1 Tax=unclassified Microbacterium TaxID=2609290 RepID=UPI00203ED44D|nr:MULTISPECIES: hypothetical protein [unclassified Microbacterium]MDT0186322.1 hypothetical protein [Microbacterium sp. ARD31]
MRTYLFRTGLFSAITSGATLVRGLKTGEFTWRTALAWLSWGITLALAIGAIIDARRAARGEAMPGDSAAHGREAELAKKRIKRKH